MSRSDRKKGVRIATMTNRERILAVLRGEPVDRAPIWLLFPWDRTTYYTDVRKEPSYAPVVEAMTQKASILNRRNFDIEVFALDFRAAFPEKTFRSSLPRALSTQEVSTRAAEAANTTNTGTHPAGTSSGSTGVSPAGALSGPSASALAATSAAVLTAAGRFLDSEEDLDVFLSLPILDEPAAIESALSAYLPGYLAEKVAFPIDTGAMMLDLGEPIGVLYGAANLLEYPIWSLTRREEITAFLGRLQKHFIEKYRWCLERDLADIYFMVGSELAAPPMVSRKTFREWILPFQKELIDLVHSYGKLVITHFHGQIRDLLDDFLWLAPDGLHTIEEPPVGNCPLSEALAKVDDRIALIGTIQYDEFRALEPLAMRAEVRRVLSQAKGRRFILSPSAGPFHPVLDDRMLDNYLAFLDEGDRFGGNHA